MRTTRKLFGFVGFLLIALIQISCNKSSQPVGQAESAQSAKRYHLKGKIVSIDTSTKSANVDAEAIPDFMGAMAMPYKVKPESELGKLKPGDPVTADVVVQGDNYWLENVVVTANGAPSAPK